MGSQEIAELEKHLTRVDADLDDVDPDSPLCTLLSRERQRIRTAITYHRARQRRQELYDLVWKRRRTRAEQPAPSEETPVVRERVPAGSR